MINRIHLVNFKAFRDQVVEIAPLTLLSGLNGSGKSSLLQSLLLLRQSWDMGYLAKDQVALNGRYVSLGTFRDALFESASDEGRIQITLSYRDAPHEGFRMVPATDPSDRLCSLDRSPPMGPRELLWGPRFRFLRAERIGPRVSYEVTETALSEVGLGISGEFAAEFLAREGDRPIALRACRHPNAQSDLLRANVEAWMGEFSPNLRIVVSNESDQDRVHLRYQFEGSRGLSNSYRPTNVGFGVSYTLPVILAVLAAQPGDLLLIEAPEAHLHPRGQAKMGELLAIAANGGVQILVETHSDHVLNGVRVAVHQRLVEAASVAFLHFQWDPKRSDGATSVKKLVVDSRGRIEDWPSGFFDEMDKSLEILLGPQPEQ